jgi:hypothetical protein
MYFRKKTSAGRAYLQIVESRREGAAVRQQVIATLGRLDELQASGQCQWRRKFPHLWRRKIPQLAGLAISRMRDQRLRSLAAGLGASASAVPVLRASCAWRERFPAADRRARASGSSNLRFG